MPWAASARRWLRRAAARRQRPVPFLAWRASRRWTAALVIAAFPFLFILDEATDLPLSPVLPGLVLLAVAIVALPFALAEAFVRLAHRREPGAAQRGTARLDQWGKAARGVAFCWFAVWLALGA